NRDQQGGFGGDGCSEDREVFRIATHILRNFRGFDLRGVAADELDDTPDGRRGKNKFLGQLPRKFIEDMLGVDELMLHQNVFEKLYAHPGALAEHRAFCDGEEHRERRRPQAALERRGKRAVEPRAVRKLFLAYLEAPSMLPKRSPE